GRDRGAETEALGWLTPYLQNHCAESLARLCGLIQQLPPHQRSSNRRGVQARLRPRVRGHCVEAARLALPVRPIEGLAEVQEPGCPGGPAGSRGGLVKGAPEISVAPPSGQDRIMIYGPKDDGTYVVEFRTAEGEVLAISIPRAETAVIRHFQERMPCLCLMNLEEQPEQENRDD